jgi:hypothetical protein
LISTKHRKIEIDDAIDEIDFIKSGNPFTVDSLNGGLDSEEKIDLIRALFDMGLLEILNKSNLSMQLA